MTRRLGRARPATLVAVTAALAAAGPAHAALWDGTPPMVLPAPAGANAATAEPPTWLIGAKAGAATRRIVSAAGGRAMTLEGTFAVPRGRARVLAARLRAAGLLRYAEPNSTLQRASAFDATPTEASPRTAVVAPGLTPPPFGGVSIGIVDDLIDTTNADVGPQTKVIHAGPGVLEGHGTEVASVASGALNGTGVFGIYPSVPLLNYAVGVNLTCEEASDGIAGVTRAGATIINLSFGGPSDCFSMFRATQAAYAAGSLVVASAGNEFAEGNPVIFPAAYPHVMSVAAIDATLQASSFSSANLAVDISAPGVGVPAAVPLAFDDDGTVDGTTLVDGTSFAAPIVAGVAAWVKAARPDLSNGQLADVLRHSAVDLPPAGYDADTGFGLVNVQRALVQPTPRKDPGEPNDDIAFVDGTAFGKPAAVVWSGTGSHTLSATADLAEDPDDVYRIRVPRHVRFRILLKPAYGNPDLTVLDRRAKSIADTNRILARSHRAGIHTDSVTLTNSQSVSRTYYVAISVEKPDAKGSITSSYKLQFVRERRR